MSGVHFLQARYIQTNKKRGDAGKSRIMRGGTRDSLTEDFIHILFQQGLGCCTIWYSLFWFVHMANYLYSISALVQAHILGTYTPTFKNMPLILLSRALGERHDGWSRGSALQVNVDYMLKM